MMLCQAETNNNAWHHLNAPFISAVSELSGQATQRRHFAAHMVLEVRADRLWRVYG
jgi:hypothetical protein